MQYSSSYYGLRAYDLTTGVVKDASAVCSVTSSVAPVGWIVNVGSGETIGTATSSATASGETFILELASTYAYGTSGYGTSAYGVDYLYNSATATSSASTDGTEVRVRIATATCSASSVMSASGRRVPEGSALVYGTSTNSVLTDANGSRIREVSVTALPTASNTIDATRVRESDSAVNGITTASGSGVFLITVAIDDSSASSSTCTPSATWSTSADTVIATSTATSTGDRVLDCSTVFTAPESTSVCDPAATFVSSANPSCTATVTAFAGYVKRSTISVNCTLNIEANGRYKYEQIAKDNETWNDVSAAGGTWTEVA